MTRTMIRRLTLPASLLAVMAASAAVSAPGGKISTLPEGQFVCELPGDASGPVAQLRPDSNFLVTNSSGYVAAGMAGTYLLTGNQLVMTSGPMQGQRYRKVSNNFLRLMAPDGSDSALRCVRRGGNNS